MKVFYSATAGAIDYVNPETGNGMYSGETPEQILARHPDIVVVEEHECRALIEAKYTKPPVEITKEAWWDYLECMPPSKWKHFAGVEMFHLCEYLTQSIVMWCVRMGDRYFRMDATDKLTPAEVAAKVVPYALLPRAEVAS